MHLDIKDSIHWKKQDKQNYCLQIIFAQYVNSHRANYYQTKGFFSAGVTINEELL